MSEVENRNLPNLLRQLIADGKLSREVAETALDEARQREVSITTHLAQKQLVNQADLARYNSNEYGLSLVDLDSIEIPLDKFPPIILYSRAPVPPIIFD